MDNLYQRLNSKIHEFTRVIIPTSLVLATLALSIVLPPAPKVSAWTQTGSPGVCPGAAILDFNYVSEIEKTWPQFKPDVVQKDLLIYDVWTGNPTHPKNTVFQYADEIKFYKNDSGQNTVSKKINSISTGQWPFWDNPINTSDDGFYQESFYFSTDPADTNRYQKINRWNGTNATTTPNTNLIPNWSATPAAGQVACIVAGINVQYDQTYTGTRYPALAPENNSYAPSCEQSWYNFAEEMACKTKNMFKSVGDAITDTAKDIGNAFTTGLAWLFVPDDAYITGLFETQKDFWNEKLGFFTFPITLFVQIFGAFIDADYTGCTETNCTYNFGNFFGGNLSINFSQMHNVSPQLWVFALLVIRITALYYLIMTIYAIGVKVMSKKAL